MATKTEYIDKIREYETPEALAELWNTHLSDHKDEEVEGFWKLGKLYEYVILRAFELEGAEVTWPYDIKLHESTVEQIDGAFVIDGMHVLCECKDKDENTNIEPFAKMRNQLSRRPSSVIGCIFVRKGYTEPAVALSRFCAPQCILLWEGDEVSYCIENRKMVEALKLKMQKAAQEFVFHYNAKTFFMFQKI